MSKIDIDKFVAFEYKRQLQFTPSNAKNFFLMALDKSLEEQGLCYKDGEIIEIESKPANFAKSCKDLQEWSEEDEKILTSILRDVKHGEPLDKLQYDWLKSLRPQNHWKPSDEQMTALRRMRAAIAGEGEIYKPLNSLYEDLKKLKEE